MKNLNEMYKKMFMILGVVVLVVAIIMIATMIFGGSKALSGEALETKAIAAAQKYYESNELPKELGEESAVTLERLEEEGLIKPLAESLKEGLSCEGSIKVQNTGNSYYYYSAIDCGEEYSSKTLSSVLKENVVTEKEGLYADGGAFTFKGENPNNNLKIGTKDYKIIEITEEGYIRALSLDISEKNQEWDDRFNDDRGSRVGYNEYGVSRIHTYIDSLYEGTESFNEYEKGMMMETNVCIGAVSTEAKTSSDSKECAKKLPNQKLSLLRLSDFTNASLEDSCTNVLDQSCQNYNYFNLFKRTLWTITAASDNSYSVFKVSNNGAYAAKASGDADVHLVLALTDRLMYTEGDGTAENPYKVK